MYQSDTYPPILRRDCLSRKVFVLLISEKQTLDKNVTKPAVSFTFCLYIGVFSHINTLREIMFYPAFQMFLVVISEFCDSEFPLRYVRAHCTEETRQHKLEETRQIKK